MESAIRAAAGIVDPIEDTHADPNRDVELAPTDPRLTKNPSRASLPISHRRSVSTFGRSRPNSASGVQRTDGDMTDDGELEEQEEDEVPWGPEHPCYPHLNPHVPSSSPLYRDTRIIRIRRDWMVAGDLAPAFSNIYPEILEPVLAEDRFRALITKLNTTLQSTFMPTTARNWIDTTMGFFTGWIWDDIGLTGAKHSLKQLEAWLESWNRDVGAPQGVSIIPLRRTAYLSLDIQIPEPQFQLEDESTMADGQEGGTNRGSGIGRPISRSTRTSNSSRRQRHANLRDDVEYGAYPVVPPIPDRYLEGMRNLAQPERGMGADGRVTVGRA